jgi:hypothetical protein
MRNYIVAAVAFVAAAVLVVARHAIAQQVASQITCAIPLDGGTSATSTTCGPVLLNYQPYTASCWLGPDYQSVQGTISVQTSGDGIHFGVPTNLVVLALPDGGSAATSAFGPTGNAAATHTKVAAVDVLDFSTNPTDPYLYAQVTANTLADGGTSDAINCYFSVVQTQTLHAPHSFKGVKPQGVKVTQ